MIPRALVAQTARASIHSFALLCLRKSNAKITQTAPMPSRRLLKVILVAAEGRAGGHPSHRDPSTQR